MLWWIGAALATVGAMPVLASVVGNDSDGALDNASGVAAVLAAAASAVDAGLAGRRVVAERRGAGAGRRARVGERSARAERGAGNRHQL